MKALYSILIAIVAAVLVAGCSKSSQPGANATALSPVDNMTALQQAIQKFNSQEGHFPKTLDELAPKYIAKVPDAPAGYAYNYNAATGELKLGRGSR
jgi:hypothetical protein